MQYLKISFTVIPYDKNVCDILAALTAEIGFDSFEEAEQGLYGYIKKDLFNNADLDATIRDFPIGHPQITYQISDIEDKDWNAEWEKHYFRPIVIADRCVIHSSFHRNVPSCEYDIVINPQMSFGTGHHATTNQLITYLLDMDLRGKHVLDMGCGTSILAILASMKGAESVTAVDNDPWCITNSKENLQLNNIHNIELLLGDASSISKHSFDIIIANINRNILLNDMSNYVHSLRPQGMILFSGFYKDDLCMIKENAESLGLTFFDYKEDNHWVAARFYFNAR